MQNITVTVTRHEGVSYANLGNSQLAEAVAAGLKARFAGHFLRTPEGDCLYYNGACDGAKPSTREAYQHLTDRILA